SASISSSSYELIGANTFIGRAPTSSATAAEISFDRSNRNALAQRDRAASIRCERKNMYSPSNRTFDRDCRKAYLYKCIRAGESGIRDGKARRVGTYRVSRSEFPPPCRFDSC